MVEQTQRRYSQKVRYHLPKISYVEGLDRPAQQRALLLYPRALCAILLLFLQIKAVYLLKGDFVFDWSDKDTQVLFFVSFPIHFQLHSLSRYAFLISRGLQNGND